MEELKHFIELHRRRLLKVAIFGAPLFCATAIAAMALDDYSSYKHQPKLAPISPDALAQMQLQQQDDPMQRRIAPIFGQYERPEERVVETSNIPTTSLDLTLHAIFFSTDPKFGSALISKQGHQKARLYTVGDPIMKGVRLEQVQVNAAVINRNGNSESLLLPRLGKEKS